MATLDAHRKPAVLTRVHEACAHGGQGLRHAGHRASTQRVVSVERGGDPAPCQHPGQETRARTAVADAEDEEEGESDSALTDNPLLILIFDDIIYINSINAPCTITNLR